MKIALENYCAESLGRVQELAADFATIHSMMNDGLFAGTLSGAVLWAIMELAQQERKT